MARAPHTAVKAEPPPGPTDVPGWQEAVRNGSYQRCRLEDVVVAVQDLRTTLAKSTLNPLLKHLSDCMMKILRKRVSRNHANEGWDIVNDVHMVLWTAIFQPTSLNRPMTLPVGSPPRQLRRSSPGSIPMCNESRWGI